MLVIQAELLRGVLEAADSDAPDLPEWPPSWMRLFAAFVDRADLAEEAPLLESLEEMPAPHIRAADATVSVRGAFVPTNKEVRGDTTTLLRRTANERHWARAIPSEPIVEYIWPEEEWSVEDREKLGSVARRIPYLGRASSPAIVSVNTEISGSDDLNTLRPFDPAAEGRFAMHARLRRPFPGSLDALRRAYDSGGDSWQVGIWDEYGEYAPARERPLAGPYGEMSILRYLGKRLDGRNTAAMTRYIRSALMSRVGDPPIPELHGHHDGSVRQIAVLGLLDVGGQHSDGHIMGAAICLPDMNRSDLVRVASAFPSAGETFEVNAGRLGVLEFEWTNAATLTSVPYGLKDVRWMRHSTTWATALPIVSDRFFKPRDSVAEALNRMLGHAGLPSLSRLLAWNRRPLVNGAPDLRPQDTLRRKGEKGFKPYFHAKFELKEPVHGPVVVGSMRHYGLGLCVPAKEEKPDE